MLQRLSTAAVSKAELDNVIRAQYEQFDVPADQITADPTLAAEFTELVNAALDTTEPVDTAKVNRRMLNLRKRGQDKGGLPRLRHECSGRTPRKPR